MCEDVFHRPRRKFHLKTKIPGEQKCSKYELVKVDKILLINRFNKNEVLRTDGYPNV